MPDQAGLELSQAPHEEGGADIWGARKGQEQPPLSPCLGLTMDKSLPAGQGLCFALLADDKTARLMVVSLGDSPD